MTAAVMYEQGLPAPFAKSNPFRIEEVELDGPGEGELLIEVRAAGLCHSDLTTMEGMRKRPLPIVGGHEGAGIIREVGKGVKGFEAGDHVALAAVAGCGNCRFCNKGRPGLCPNVSGAKAQGVLANGARRLRLANGGTLHHYSGISVYAQYAVVAPESVVKIDKSVPMDVAALFGCGVLTGAGAVLNGAKVEPGSSVAVIGLGGVGLSAVMAAREAGASQIIGVDVLASKFELATALGCTSCVNAMDADAVKRIIDMTDGGTDYTFEVSGVLPGMATAQAITARGGEVVGIGLGMSNATFPVLQMPWICEERVLRGSFMGSGQPFKDIPRLVDLYMKGRMPVDKLLSSHITFDQLNDGFDKLAAGTVVRQVLLPHG